jgi:hypothetical protein
MLRDELCNVKFLRFSLEKCFLIRYVGKRQLSKIFFENILLTVLLLIEAEPIVLKKQIQLNRALRVEIKRRFT